MRPYRSTATLVVYPPLVRLLMAASAVTTLACRGDDVAAPSLDALDAPGLIIAGDARAMNAAAAIPTDSAASVFYLADATIEGRPGEAVTLTWSYDAELTSVIGAARVVAMAGDERVEIPLSSSYGSATVFTFDAPGEVTIQYALSRATARRIGGRFTVSQVIGAGSRVVSFNTPWADNGRTPVLRRNISGTGVYVPAPGTYGDVIVGITPYYPGNPYGDFQSWPDTRASDPITITFSRPVGTVTVTTHDPDFAGNKMLGIGADGDTVEVAFQHDSTPFRMTLDTRSVSNPPGIVQVVLIPAPGEYIAYSGLSFNGGKLDMSCGPSSPLRGQTVTCTASAIGAATIVVQSWTFDPVNAALPDVVSAVNTNAWSGPLVAEGDVRLSALVDGTEATASFHVTPQARNWSSVTGTFTVVEEPQTEARTPIRPKNVGHLGNTVFTDGAATVDTTDFATVVSGPNQGYVYATGAPVAARAGIQLNRLALKRQSAFWKLQRSSPKSPFCGRNDVEPYLPRVSAHEGLALQTNSRTQLYKAKMDELAGPRSESLVAANVAGFTALANSVAAEVATAARANAARADTQFPITYCTFAYFN